MDIMEMILRNMQRIAEMFETNFWIIPQMKDVKNWLNMHWGKSREYKESSESYGVKFDGFIIPI